LKDLHRAILVGETTFGKGSVQTVQPLGNGVGLRLTMAKYYTPSHRTIHEVGVSPDIDVPISDAEERRIVLVQSHRALTPEEQVEAAKMEDRQHERAVTALRSVRIYRDRQAMLNAPKSPAPSPKADDAVTK